MCAAKLLYVAVWLPLACCMAALGVLYGCPWRVLLNSRLMLDHPCRETGSVGQVPNAICSGVEPSALAPAALQDIMIGPEYSDYAGCSCLDGYNRQNMTGGQLPIFAL